MRLVPLVELLPFVSEPEVCVSLPEVVVPTLVSALPWLVVSVSRDAHPTSRAAAASMQMICFIYFVILFVPFANIIAQGEKGSNGGKHELGT